jgi:hypothetical protein
MAKKYPCAGRTLVTLCTLVVVSCTSASNDLDLQSKFSYPNGDYTSLGHVSAEKKYVTASFGAPEMTREVFLDLQQQALSSQPGADFVVNYVISSSVTQVPPIPVSWTTFCLEGTAIKFLEVGGQKYSGDLIPSPTRTK